MPNYRITMYDQENYPHIDKKCKDINEALKWWDECIKQVYLPCKHLHRLCDDGTSEIILEA